jgi:hypothetical protein
MQKAYHKAYFFFLLMLVNCHVSLSQSTVEWTWNYGGSLVEDATEMISTSDGGFMILGSTNSSDIDFAFNYGDFDIFIMKLDEHGLLMYTATFGGSNDDLGFGLVELNNGNFLIAGYSNSADGIFANGSLFGEGFILEINEFGARQGLHFYGGNDGDGLYDIVEDASGNIYACGATVSNVPNYHGMLDGYVVKLDSNFNVIWEKAFGGSGTDELSRIELYLDSTVLIGGYAISTDGDITGLHGVEADFWVLKVDPNGNVLRSKCFGGSSVDKLNDLLVDSVGNVVLTGYTFSNDGNVSGNHLLPGDINSDAWVLKIDSNFFWNYRVCIGGYDAESGMKLVGGANNTYYLACETSSNDTIISCGYSQPNISLYALDNHLNATFLDCFGGDGEDFPTDLLHLDDSTFVIYGSSTSTPNYYINNHYGNGDNIILKINPYLYNGFNSNSISNRIFAIQGNYIIGYNLKGEVKIEVVDLSGEVKYERVMEINDEVNLDMNSFNLSYGFYIVRIWYEYQPYTFKVVLTAK